MKTVSPQIQKAQWTSSIRDMKKTTPTHVITKLLKSEIKRESGKAERKIVTYGQWNKDKDGSRFCTGNYESNKITERHL